MTENQELLAAYVKSGSESAFRELLTRYLDLVYSTAVRLVDGDTHRAEDVAQIVFTDLARMAGKLSANTLLGGWLHHHTCFVARNVLRGERRRQIRERQAVEMNSLNAQTDENLAQISPILDEAIQELGADDRDAVLLRFFERRNLRSVGEALGISENVAQKRVARALGELEGLLKRKGVALSATALAGCLGVGAVSAAPPALAGVIAGSIFCAGSAAGGLAAATAKAAAATKLKVGIVAAMLLVWVGSVVVLRTESGGRSSKVVQTTAPLPEQSLPAIVRRPAPARPEFVPTLASDTVAPAQSPPVETPPRAVASPPAVVPVTNPFRRPAAVPGLPVLFTNATRLDARSGSKVRLDGTSSLHDWQVESPLITGFMEVGPGFPYGPEPTNQPGAVFARAEATVMVRQLRSVELNGHYYSDSMDNVMRATLNMQQHPEITYHLNQLWFMGGTNNSRSLLYVFWSRGDLVVAGVTNETLMPLTLEPTKPDRFRIDGHTTLQMSSFGINPAALMQSITTVAGEVDVSFIWAVGNDHSK